MQVKKLVEVINVEGKTNARSKEKSIGVDLLLEDMREIKTSLLDLNFYMLYNEFISITMTIAS